jgi:hypothetical protein
VGAKNAHGGRTLTRPDADAMIVPMVGGPAVAFLIPSLRSSRLHATTTRNG